MSEWGEAAEIFAREVAGELGLPDFVYDPVVVDNDELSDGLLAVRDRGLILQSKARDPSKADSPARAESWIRKQIEGASRQYRGTRKRLEQLGPHTLTSRRGFEREFAAQMEWRGVVIIDHPSVPADLVFDATDDLLVVTLRDWYALNAMIRSSRGVIDYVVRALQTGDSASLGEEYRRYDALASADLRACRRAGGTRVPDLPPKALSSYQIKYLELLREWVDEDIAVVANGPLSWSDPDHYRKAVELLDCIPALRRVQIGESLVDLARTASDAGVARGRTVIPRPGIGQIVALCDIGSNWEKDQFEAFMYSLMRVRHDEFQSSLPDAGPTLMFGRLAGFEDGVLRTWGYIEGVDLDEIPSEVRWSIIEDHGTFQGSRIVDPTRSPRNAPCPCGAGAKYKRCHGR